MLDRKQILQNKTDEYLKKYSDADRQQFTESYLKHVSRPTRKIYVDLELLQDINLGAILFMTQDDPKAFAYIKDSIPFYNRRNTDDTLAYFPDLQITQAQLDAYIQDENNHYNLLLLSPPMSTWYFLRNHHEYAVKENKALDGIVDDASPHDVTYVINTYPLDLSLEWSRVLKYKFMLGVRDPEIKLGVLCDKHLTNTPIEYFTRDTPDILLSYRFSQTIQMEESSLRQALFDNRLLYTKVGAYPLVGDTDVLKNWNSYDQDQLNKMELATTTMLQFYCEFSFVRGTVDIFDKDMLLE